MMTTESILPSTRYRQSIRRTAVALTQNRIKRQSDLAKEEQL